jgi:hypothetical protein
MSGGAGTAGSAGASGAGGMSGAGGVAGASGMAGNAGHGGMAGSGGSSAVTTATGVEVLSVPLMLTGDGQRYNVQNRSSPSAPYDLSGQTLVIRAYAPGAIGGDLSVFFRSSSTTDSPATKVALSTLTSGFVNVSVTVPAATGGFDPTMVDVIRIEVEADATYGTTFQTPNTIVYLDSVTTANSVVSQLFSTTPATTDFMPSGARPLTGSTNTWAATYP